MKTKISILKEAAARGDWKTALGIAAKFPRLGAEKVAIMRGHEGFVRPDFLRQIKRDPQDCINVGIAALRTKYAL